MCHQCLFPGYRSGDYQSRYGYNSAGSSQNRGPWLSGFGPSPPFEYQHRNQHYNNHHQPQSTWNNYQSTQQGYQSQGVCMSFHCYRIQIYLYNGRKIRFDLQFSIFLFYIFYSYMQL